MPRAKTGVVRRRKHKKILKLAKGYWGLRSKSFRKARETLFAAGNYAYAHRKRRKRDFRRLWIVRINAAARANGTSYGRFIHGLSLASIELDRKVLSDLAIRDEVAFTGLVKTVQAALQAKAAAPKTAQAVKVGNGALEHKPANRHLAVPNLHLDDPWPGRLIVTSHFHSLRISPGLWNTFTIPRAALHSSKEPR